MNYLAQTNGSQPTTRLHTNQPKLPLSAFIICLNEEKYLADCIESLRQCTEIVVVDSGSTDGTKSLVQNYINAGWPIRFIYEKWRGYAGQKQFALEQCTQPWCLSIDADERLDEVLMAELPSLLQSPTHVDGFRVPIRPYLIGYGYTPMQVKEKGRLRLIRNGSGAFDLKKQVHEGIITRGTNCTIERGNLLHFRPLPIEDQILKENKYSTLKADQWIAAGKSPRPLRLLFNPPAYFLRQYLRHGLWRCGFAGFIHAMTSAVYSFLTEAKIYQRSQVESNAAANDKSTENARRLSA